MTNAEMIALVESMSGESSDAVVSAYLSMAGQQIINYVYQMFTYEERAELTVPTCYQQKQVEFAVYMLNKRGAEGQTVHNENGINRSYENGGIPQSMFKGIIPFCRVL